MKRLIRVISVISLAGIVISGCKNNTPAPDPATPEVTVSPVVTTAPESTETPTITVIPEVTDTPEITEGPETTKVTEITETTQRQKDDDTDNRNHFGRSTHNINS